MRAPIDVWIIPLDTTAEEASAALELLAPEERSRAASFRFRQDRERFALSHAGLRKILATCVGVDPRMLKFAAGPTGKPRLEGETAIRFNLSHSGALAVVAVSREREVGVDCERIDSKMDIDSVAKRAFSVLEFRRWKELPVERRVDGFFSCWTRKEAYLKGRGLGLAHPTDRFTVPVDPENVDPYPVEEAEGVGPLWTTRAIPMASGYKGAVAAEGAGLEARVSRLDPSDSKGTLKGFGS